MKGEEGAQRRCPPIPPLESLFRHDHYGFLAVPRDTLGFVSKRSLDELGEFGPGLVLNSSNVASANGKRLPPEDQGHKAEGWRRELVPFLHSLLPIAGLNSGDLARPRLHIEFVGGKRCRANRHAVILPRKIDGS